MATGSSSAAPGQLALVQALLNTIDLQSGRDDFSSPAGMEAWFAARRLTPPGTQLDEADRGRIVELRRALHDLLATGTGHGGQRRAVTTLNEAARVVRLGVRLHPDDGYRVMAEGVGIDRPIGDLLITITAAMANGTWRRLKICANPECRRAFYDGSRNRSARWCSMAVCGNRMKGRAYRQRARAGAGSKTANAAPIDRPAAVAVAS